jgi:hypothetical protein
MKTPRADRGLLHKNCLEDFKAYLTACGVSHRQGNGDYEVLQVRLPDGTWPKLYRRESTPEHLTVQGSLVRLVEGYLESRRWPVIPEAAPEAASEAASVVPALCENSAPWD